MTEKKLNLDSVAAAINNEYDRRNSGAQEGAVAQKPNFFDQAAVPAPAPAPEVAPVTEEVRQERSITAPFIILEFKANEENPQKIDSFTAYAEGVHASPEAIISHLQMVIDTITEQTAAAAAEEAASAE